ncbi:hypothetical protein OsI_32918 [Oryza sativa Indica Group]|uniref:Uncharacterized protein n=1 Tax=Oryza sativa subsp. indica TaxID=39946 RepID=B8BFZ9_ORYSI|nr:hypothetical protein OsI_32918 [Oryza sativa Indica Group]
MAGQMFTVRDVLYIYHDGYNCLLVAVLEVPEGRLTERRGGGVKRNFFITPIYGAQVQQATVCSQFSSAGPSISRVCTQTIGDATAGAAAARRRFSFASQKSIRDSAALVAPRHCHVPTTGAACWHHRPAAADLMEDNINTDNMADCSHVPVPPPNQTNVSRPYFPNPYQTNGRWIFKRLFGTLY